MSTDKFNGLAKNVLARLTSRKLWLAVIGVAIPILFDLTPEQLTAIEGVIITFIGVEGARDFREAGK